MNALQVSSFRRFSVEYNRKSISNIGFCLVTTASKFLYWYIGKIQVGFNSIVFIELQVHCRIYLVFVSLHQMSLLSIDILQYQVGLFRYLVDADRCYLFNFYFVVDKVFGCYGYRYYYFVHNFCFCYLDFYLYHYYCNCFHYFYYYLNF